MAHSRVEASRRAPPLPPDQRRRAIVDSALPLIIERGVSVTTKEIAEAAGVSEGTIFNVFADKDQLIDAVVAAATDIEPIEAAISSIAPDLEFADQLVVATELIQRRITDIWRLLSKLTDRDPGARHTPRLPDNTALTTLMSAHRDQLDVAADEAARMLRSLTLALTHPMLTPEPVAASEIVERFLFGCASDVRRGARP